tara:strand:+ start:186 stop:839 length:654 start_codon:yes stop_codon:yes gene_type:complete
MRKIACVGYRGWALNIYKNLQKHTDLEFLIISSKNEYSDNKIIDYDPDIVLFYGWSWLISDTLIQKYTCLMLHPSPLPKYRGGSPIQNQIISGEKLSMVSIFIINNKMDEGDIIGQAKYSLEGKLSSIFSRIEDAGTKLTLGIIKNGFTPVKQNHKDATYFKRRKPEESEITIDEILTKDSTFLNNKIRMLADPYPNAFIKTSDGKKLLIKESEIID